MASEHLIKKTKSIVKDYEILNNKTTRPLMDKTIDIDNYQIKETLGQGAFGRVVKATDKINNQMVVIKILSKIKNGRGDVKNEVNVLKYMKNQCDNYFLCYINQTEDKDSYYIITEFFTGSTTLSSILADFDFLTVSNLKLIVKNLINAIISLHDLQVAHRDLKPENILINRNTCQIKIIDFGLSCYLNCPEYGLSGTPSYQPPEAFPLNIDQTWSIKQRQLADIFALGNILWVLLSLQPLTRFQIWQNTKLFANNTIKEYFQTYKFPSELPILSHMDQSIVRLFNRVKPPNPSHDFKYSIISMLAKDPNERSFFESI